MSARRTADLVVSDEVREALAAGRAVVALETTLVTHGLPHPQGVEAAMMLDADVREGGAIPATIGVLDGGIRVGLTAAELERLATAGDVAKLNLGNFASQLAAGLPGSTTVAATMFAAARTGITVFATGGIGGVHQGALDTFDESADLSALATFPVAVVSAGAKAILDLPRTLEVLETLGVLVLGYGTSEFPAFYARESGLALEHRVDDAGTAARILAARWALGLGGVLIANPIPAAAALDPARIDAAIAQALAAAADAGVHGKALTPFLLAHLAGATEGASVAANRALALCNAGVGAAVAVALCGQ